MKKITEMNNKSLSAPEYEAPDAAALAELEEECAAAAGQAEESTAVDDSLVMYLREIGEIPLLTQEEEQELSRAIRLGLETRDMLAELEAYGMADPAAIDEMKAVIRAGERAKDRMVSANLRLVVSVAKKYRGNSLPMQDMIQDGNIGLMKAAEKFDPALGYRFSTYAIWWIRQAVTRAIANQGSTIRIPTHLAETASKVNSAFSRMARRDGEEPTPEMLAEELGMPVEKVREILALRRDTVSLETPIGDDGDGTLGGLLVDPNSAVPFERVAETEKKAKIAEILATLSPREQEILRMRFGFETGETQTLECVGKKLNITRERVRQLEEKALRKLRHPQYARCLMELAS